MSKAVSSQELHSVFGNSRLTENVKYATLTLLNAQKGSFCTRYHFRERVLGGNAYDWMQIVAPELAA